MPAEKECPFCGSKRGVYYLYGTDSCKWGAARCIDCGAQAPEVRTGYDESEGAAWHKDALEEWNRRANTMEAGGTDKQQLKPKMPSLAEFLTWCAGTTSGGRSNESIYYYFARHFGH